MDQEKLNVEMLESGSKRYWNNLIKSRGTGKESRVGYGQEILRHVIPDFLEEIDEFREDLITSFRAPAQLNYYRLLHSLPSPLLAYLASSVIVDGLSKNLSLNQVSLAIGRRLEDEVRWNSLKKENPELFKGVMHYNRKYGNSYEYCRDGFMGAVRKVSTLEWRLFGTGERASTGYVLLELFRRSTGIIEYLYLYQEGLLGSKGVARRKLYITPTKETLDWIKDYNSSKKFLKPTYLPTIEKPLDWTGLNEGGYKLPKFFFIKGKPYHGNSIGLMTCQHSANIAQSTKFKVNKKVYKVAEWLWDNGIQVGELVHSHPEEMPNKPVNIDSDEVLRKRWRKQAGATHKRNFLSQGKRFLTSRILHLARRFKKKDIWFPCQLDFRSRMYYAPSFFNPQGNDLSRGLLQFAEPTKIDSEDAENWFLIYGANLMGMDKKLYNERLDHVKQEHERIIAVAEDPEGTLEFWEEEDDPFKFLAWAFEYSSWCKDPSSFISHLPIHIDATCNGLQILSLLSGDEESARQTNVIPSEGVQDIYQDVADQMNKRVLAETDPELKQYADKWHELGITRKLVKNSVMIVPYSGTYHAFSRNFMDYLNNQIVDHFVDKVKATNYLATVFVECLRGFVGKPLELMNWFRAISDEFTNENIPMTWKTPTGFTVTQNYLKGKQRHIKSRMGDACKWIRFNSDLPEKDGMKMKNAISANIVHSLDASILHLAVSRGFGCGIDSFSLIHDSFGIPANKVKIFQDILKNEIFTTFSLDLLESFRKSWEKQLGKSLPEFNKSKSFNLNAVKNSDYFFC